MTKDRAAPFSKKHRRYWIPVLGGMVVIGGINLALGMCAYPGSDTLYKNPEHIVPILPDVRPDAAPMPDAAPAPSPADAAPSPR